MRRRIDLDFSGRPRGAPRLGRALLLTGALLALLTGARVAQLWSEKAADEGRLAAIAQAGRAAARPAPRAPVDARTAARLASRKAAGREVAKSLQSPWADLLDVLEVRPEGQVALLSVEPSAVKRTVSITAEARDPAAMLEHLSLLQNDKRLVDVVLVSHQRLTTMPGEPWRYQIQGSW